MGSLEQKDRWNVTIAHNDFRPTNIILLGEKVKLNDYNAGEIVRFNITSGTHCLFRRDPPVSPYKSSPERAKGEPMSASSDVYALGSILYGLLVGRMPFAELPVEKAFQYIKDGILPTFPSSEKERRDPAIAAVIHQAEKCWSYHENERPSAFEVASELDRAVKEVERRG